MKIVLLLSLICLVQVSIAQVQCTTDVSINEGDAIEVCDNNYLPISASSGFVSYAWTGPQSGIGQTLTPTIGGAYIVVAEDALGCVSSDTIEVILHTTVLDSIVSNPGDTICGASGVTTLSLNNSYASYDWGNGNTNPTLDVTTPGLYDVTVIDANGCPSEYLKTVFQIEFTLDANYGNDCSGGAVVLTATGGQSYLWSTGETGNSIVVVANETTDYFVTATNGNCEETTDITVNVSENVIDFELPDSIVVAADEPIGISGPAHFDSYAWSPSDQLSDTSGQITYFQGTVSQTIQLEATHPDGCTLTWTTQVIVVDLDAPNGFSPNGDGYNDFFVVPELDSISGSLVVWNRWGDIVYQSTAYKNDWAGTCDGPRCMGNGQRLPEGTYFFQVNVLGITQEGYVTLKR